jgi:hypothetical protein
MASVDPPNPNVPPNAKVAALTAELEVARRATHKAESAAMTEKAAAAEALTAVQREVVRTPSLAQLVSSHGKWRHGRNPR